MKSNKIICCLVLIGLFSQYSFANQCVAGDLKINSLSGILLFSNQTVIADLPLRLYKDGLEKNLVAETRTNDKGEFSFDNIGSGKYYLSVRQEYLTTLLVLLKVKKKRTKENRIGLKITMALDQLNNCSQAETRIE